MRRRELLGAALTGGLGLSSILGRPRPSRGGAELHADAQRPRPLQSRAGGTTGARRTSGTPPRSGPLSSVAVGRRDLTVELGSDGRPTLLGLVFDDAVVYRHRVPPDQTAVSIDLYDVELDYRDATYRRSGYRPGTYTVVAYDGRARVDELELALRQELVIEDVTVRSVPVAGGPTVPHLVYALTNTGSGPTYVHELHYRDARSATAVLENPGGGRDLYAERDHEIQVLPATRTPTASPPVRLFAETERGTGDDRFLAPKETRRYLGPPIGDTYHDPDGATAHSLEPPSSTPTVSVEAVSGNTGPQDPDSTPGEKEQFAGLAADHLDAVSIASYDLRLAASDPVVTDRWAYYATVSVAALERTGTWRVTGQGPK